MVVGEAPDGLGLVEQLDTTLHQGLLDLFDLQKEPVGQRLVMATPLYWH